MRFRWGGVALAPVLVVVMALGVLASCSSKGSSSASDPGTTAAADTSSTAVAPTTTAVPGSPKALFLEQGNAICTTMGADLQTLGSGVPSEPSAADQASLFSGAAAVMDVASTQLKALTPPPGDVAAVAAVTAVLDELAAAARAYGLAAGSGDQNAIDAANARGNAASEQMKVVAGGYGLAACIGS